MGTGAVAGAKDCDAGEAGGRTAKENAELSVTFGEPVAL